MGTRWLLEMNLKPWNDDSFHWMIFEGEYDQEKMVIFDKTWCWFGCDTFPIFEYPHNTWLWVGLNWKFMHLSMGSLWTHVIGVTLEAASVVEKWCEIEVNCTAKPCAVPSLTVGLHWEAKIMGRGAHTMIYKWKVRVDDPRTELRLFRVIPDGCNQMLWHKRANSAECKPIRIAVSTVTDGWKDHTVPLSDVS